QDHHLADAGVGGLEEEFVNKRGPGGHEVDHQLDARPRNRFDVDRPGQQRGIGIDTPHTVTRGVHEHARERVVDEWILALGLGGTRRGNTKCGGTHALSDVPGIVVGTRHPHFPSKPESQLVPHTIVPAAGDPGRSSPVAYASSQTAHRLQRSAAMTRTPQEVFAHHGKALAAGDLDEIVVDYADDSVLITPAGVARGKDRIRKAFTKLLDDLPDAAWDLKNQIFDGDVLFLE